jgi:hypothetical protein
LYWPLELIVPGPEIASPPETDQFTLAAPLPRVAENCSIVSPDELLALQPVQFVSRVAVPGETFRLPLEEMPATSPPQPAMAKSTGNRTLARTRPSHGGN